MQLLQHAAEARHACNQTTHHITWNSPKIPRTPQVWVITEYLTFLKTDSPLIIRLMYVEEYISICPRCMEKNTAFCLYAWSYPHLSCRTKRPESTSIIFQTSGSKTEPYVNRSHMQKARLFQSTACCKERQPDTLLQGIMCGNMTQMSICNLESLENIHLGIDNSNSAKIPCKCLSVNLKTPATRLCYIHVTCTCTIKCRPSG